MTKVICAHCRKYVDYEIKEIEQEAAIKNEQIIYKEKLAYCKECGEEVWVEELEKANVLEPINLYCEQEELISPRQISEILEKYNIGKRPLSSLLGWGEITISRFLDGQLPSREYSNKLFAIFNNPKIFRDVLIKNKNKITQAAFKKASKATEQIIDSEFDKEILKNIYTCQPRIGYVINGNRKEVNIWHRKSCYC